jgi:hypothetical protein
LSVEEEGIIFALSPSIIFLTGLPTR